MIPINSHPKFDGDFLGIGLDLVNNGRVTKSSLVDTFEKCVAETYECEHAISTSSGTIALYLAQMALRKYHKIPTNEAPIIQIPYLTWDSVELSCQMAGFKPEFVDVDPLTYHILDVADKKTDFRMIMDIFGNVCPSPKNVAFNNTIVDASHSFGAPDDELRGIAQVYSLNGGKIFTAGEGGIILTNDTEYMKILTKLRDLVGRISTMTAAIGLESLIVLEDNIDKRYKNYLYYISNLDSLYMPQKIPITTNYYMFAVRTINASHIQEKLRDKGIDTRRYYSDVFVPTYCGLNTSILKREMLCIPTGYDIDVKYIVNEMNKIISEPNNELWGDEKNEF